MKKLVLLVCLFLISLTLASDTQHRFRVFVDVGSKGKSEDTHITNLLKTHLKRELHLLEDVDIVEWDEEWHFALDITYIQHQLTDGRKTGWISLADGIYQKIPRSYFKADRYPHLLGSPVYLGGFSGIGVAVYPRDELDQYCLIQVGSIDKNHLTPIRALLR